MCDVGTALKVGGAVFSKMGEKRDQESYYAQTRAASISSMNDQATQANLKFEEENRTALQEAYDLSLKDRAHEAAFLVQAVENGVTGISVNDGFMALKNSSARSNIRFKQEGDSRDAAHQAHLAGLAAQAGSRINSAAPTTSSTDVLLAGAGVGIQGAHEAGLFDDFKIGKG